MRLLYTQPLQAVVPQKLIYVPAEEQRLCRIPDYDQSGVDETSVEGIESANSDEGDLASFDPGLLPETTEVYPKQGAEIHSFRILDSDGRTVNILKQDQNYQFEVSGQFLSDSDGIYFGIHIRTVSGIMITGQRHPEAGKFIGQVRAGEGFRIKYEFKMNLLPGAYFVGGGIWSNHEPNCLHRVMDALMFRVSPDEKLKSFGYVDLSSKEPVLEIL
jgi:lipopolysaccharide transport system ATP-binding protein